MPELTTVVLNECAFEHTTQFTLKNAGSLANHPSILRHNPEATVRNDSELTSLSPTITHLIVDCCCCNDSTLKTFCVSYWKQLKVIEIGAHSMKSVRVVRLVGLNALEKVIVGMHCFTSIQAKDKQSKCSFTLRDCERLKELRVGRESFSDYSVFDVSNLPSLEVIEMGSMEYCSSNFYSASLELRNLPKLKSLLLSCNAFANCCRVVLENLPELTSIQLGTSALRYSDEAEDTVLIMRGDDSEANE
ncbi:hypothetical protein BLSTO_04958 [Blastocystis sp. subtype 1]